MDQKVIHDIITVEMWESTQGNYLHKKNINNVQHSTASIVTLLLEERYQEIKGFGGSFTESSAYVLSQISEVNCDRIVEAYFGDSGAKYSLTRTTMGSCDFALQSYSYASVPDDCTLQHFSIEHDKTRLIPFIKKAQSKSSEGFKIIASPWSAPPWMKDNNHWCGGKLLPHHYLSWALYFTKYINSYEKEGITIWAVTIENEPLGNDSNWESMHFTPQEMNDFAKNYLKPNFIEHNLNVKILGYDQNRDSEMIDWVDTMYGHINFEQVYDGIAVHWYGSTYEVFSENLQYTHQLVPHKLIINTEACIDAQGPRWKDDQWYWSENATDWGYTWAPENKKYLHPPYSPVKRYVLDIIGCMNNWVNGWIDWNMVLDRQGGPNWAKNWCIAPVIVDVQSDEVYFTPLYYVMTHFSRFIRPGAVRLGFTNEDASLQLTSVQNLDSSIITVLYNPTFEYKNVKLLLFQKAINTIMKPQSIQTLVIQIS